MLPPKYRCGTVREVNRERAGAVPEKREDIALGSQKTPGQPPIGAGISPTVERMFGALVNESDEDRDEGSADLEPQRASRLRSP